MKRLLSVVQVNTRDDRGEDAVRTAWALHRAYRQFGIDAWMAVGQKFSIDPNVLEIPNEESRPKYAKVALDISCRIQLLNYHYRSLWRLGLMLKWLVEPGRYRHINRGIEDFYYPGTWRILDIYPERPDVIHCHNLWGYFDLRVLPWLSRELPIILTLHDDWLFSGHCKNSLGCERYKIGCGQCPYPESPYPVERDATDYNLRQKKKILARSRLYVASPSRWMLDRVNRSILADAVAESRVIPYGVDISVFYPVDKHIAEARLKIGPSTKVILSATIPAKKNVREDYQTIRSALKELSKQLPDTEVLVIAFGEPAPSERIGKIEIRFICYPKNPEIAAGYYQAADVYVHADSCCVFPLAVLEALASGVPVVATAAGGVPEQIEDGYSGYLISPGDVNAMVLRLHQLLADETLRQRMSRQAAETAACNFNLQRQVNDYLNWYEELSKKYQDRCPADSDRPKLKPVISNARLRVLRELQ